MLRLTHTRFQRCLSLHDSPYKITCYRSTELSAGAHEIDRRTKTFCTQTRIILLWPTNQSYSSFIITACVVITLQLDARLFAALFHWLQGLISLLMRLLITTSSSNRLTIFSLSLSISVTFSFYFSRQQFPLLSRRLFGILDRNSIQAATIHTMLWPLSNAKKKPSSTEQSEESFFDKIPFQLHNSVRTTFDLIISMRSALCKNVFDDRKKKRAKELNHFDSITLFVRQEMIGTSARWNKNNDRKYCVSEALIGPAVINKLFGLE